MPRYYAGKPEYFAHDNEVQDFCLVNDVLVHHNFFVILDLIYRSDSFSALESFLGTLALSSFFYSS